MTVITLPAEIETPLIEAAHRQGVTPERLAVDSLRKLFPADEVALADTSEAMSFVQMSQAFLKVGKPVPDEANETDIDLDEYPLY